MFDRNLYKRGPTHSGIQKRSLDYLKSFEHSPMNISLYYERAIVRKHGKYINHWTWSCAFVLDYYFETDRAHFDWLVRRFTDSEIYFEFFPRFIPNAEKIIEILKHYLPLPDKHQFLSRVSDEYKDFVRRLYN